MRVESWEKRVGRKEEAREDGGARLSAITSHSSRFRLLSALFLFLDKGGVGIPGRGGLRWRLFMGNFLFFFRCPTSPVRTTLGTRLTLHP